MREHDYDEVLRRALHTATDTIEPAGDGLQRIRARLATPRPLATAWLVAGYSDFLVPTLARLWSAMADMWLWLRPDDAGHLGGGSLSDRYGWLRPDAGRGPGGSGLSIRYGWLRPIAVAAAIAIVVAGGFALAQLKPTVSSTAIGLPLGPGSPSSQAGSPYGTAAGVLPGSTGPSSARLGPHSQSPSPSPSCTAVPARRGPGSTPTPTPTTSPSPTPTQTSTPTTTPTPSGSPTSAPSATSGSTAGQDVTAATAGATTATSAATKGATSAATRARTSAASVRPARSLATAIPHFTTKSIPPLATPCGPGHPTPRPHRSSGHGGAGQRQPGARQAARLSG